MGKIHEAPLRDLAERLIPSCGLIEFVETGTDQGDALPWAASRFAQVTTIEILNESYQRAVARHGALGNVRFVCGDSASVLPEIVCRLAGPSLFWLDAHAGAGFYASADRCPLLPELSAIVASPLNHCIVIDDARAFIAPPPPPFDYRCWPSLDQLMAIVLQRRDRYTVIINDAIVIVPIAVRAVLANYCAEVRPRI